MYRALCCVACLAVAPAAALADEPAAVPSGAASATVVLSDAGAEPRRALRYALRDVGPQTARMDLDMSISMDVLGETVAEALPTMTTTLRALEPQVSRDGDLSLTIEMSDLSIAPDAEQHPLLSQELEAALAAIPTVRAELTIDDRGTVIDSSFDFSGLAPSMHEQIDSVMQSMQQSVVVFPEEEVGVGAKWSVSLELTSNGFTFGQITEYEVTAVSDSSVSVSATTRQSADAQTLAIPGLPPEMTAELLAYEGSGSGTMTIRFDRAMSDGEMAATNSMRMRTGTTDGSGPSMDMAMGFSLSTTMVTAE